MKCQKDNKSKCEVKNINPAELIATKPAETKAEKSAKDIRLIDLIAAEAEDTPKRPIIPEIVEPEECIQQPVITEELRERLKKLSQD